MTYVSRDPFARTELHRELSYNVSTARASGATCDWCGQTKTLYRYQTESDGGRVSRHPGRFCSASCFRTYNGE